MNAFIYLFFGDEIYVYTGNSIPYMSYEKSRTIYSSYLVKLVPADGSPRPKD